MTESQKSQDGEFDSLSEKGRRRSAGEAIKRGTNFNYLNNSNSELASKLSIWASKFYNMKFK